MRRARTALNSKRLRIIARGFRLQAEDGGWRWLPPEGGSHKTKGGSQDEPLSRHPAAAGPEGPALRPPKVTASQRLNVDQTMRGVNGESNDVPLTTSIVVVLAVNATWSSGEGNLRGA